jgi:hypothetical protein
MLNVSGLSWVLEGGGGDGTGIFFVSGYGQQGGCGRGRNVEKRVCFWRIFSVNQGGGGFSLPRIKLAFSNRHPCIQDSQSSIGTGILGWNCSEMADSTLNELKEWQIRE